MPPTGFYERPLLESQWHMPPVAWQAAARHWGFSDFPHTQSGKEPFGRALLAQRRAKGRAQTLAVPAVGLHHASVLHNDKFDSPTLQPGPVPMLRLKALGGLPQQLATSGLPRSYSCTTL